MKILITGNMGYVGPVLIRHLRARMPDAYLIGYDSGYFGHCLTGSTMVPEARLDEQHFGDMRRFPDRLINTVDSVVHLAAISNDPMGSKFETVTAQINYEASANLASRALAKGAKRFVFASSCSMYGFAEGGPRKETDALNPLTAYARSKVQTEQALAALDTRNAVVTSLRFSTACGMSDRLRLDLVLNDFVACALASGTISVLSDGSPWRPLIDVQDMCRAIEWALIRDPRETAPYLAVNVGSEERNYQVRDLANAVARAVPGVQVSINTSAPPDRRSYKVDFALYRKVAPGYQPVISLDQSISELVEGMRRMNFHDKEFRASTFMRLKVLEAHLAAKRLDNDLFWIKE